MSDFNFRNVNIKGSGNTFGSKDKFTIEGKELWVNGRFICYTTGITIETKDGKVMIKTTEE